MRGCRRSSAAFNWNCIYKTEITGKTEMQDPGRDLRRVLVLRASRQKEPAGGGVGGPQTSSWLAGCAERELERHEHEKKTEQV